MPSTSPCEFRPNVYTKPFSNVMAEWYVPRLRNDAVVPLYKGTDVCGPKGTFTPFTLTPSSR